MNTSRPTYSARVARASRRALGPIHAATLEGPGPDVVTLCGVHLPKRRAVTLPDVTAVSCWRCERGMASPVVCLVLPFPGVELETVMARRQRMAELWRLAGKAYRLARRLRGAVALLEWWELTRF